MGVGPGVAASSLAAPFGASAGTPEREAPANADGGDRRLPRLIYYNDAHHFHAKRIDPPVSRFQLQRPVDEVLGTGVGMLVLGLGYGDVYFHDSKVGRVVGQEKQTWEHIIDWRIMCMVRDARKLGTDQAGPGSCETGGEHGRDPGPETDTHGKLDPFRQRRGDPDPVPELRPSRGDRGGRPYRTVVTPTPTFRF